MTVSAVSDPANAPVPQRVLGACPHDCPDTCALVTTVENGVAVKLQGNAEHFHTGGVLCTKVSRYLERNAHPERLTTPLRRVGPKGSGRFETASWDEALDTIAARLRGVADPQTILPYSYAGTMGLVQGESMDRRFFHKLGASLLDRTICSSAGGEALAHTLGAKVGMRVEFFAEAKLILIWGSNSIGSNLHFWRHAQTARRHGARLVCIDPRRTETADKCDEHIALLPGTDAALALSLMHELVVNDLLDHDYIERHTLGWDKLRRRAMQWPPARAAEVCGVPAAQIAGLAAAYGSIRPAAIRLNYGMQRVRGGGNATRAIACLPALVGAWRQRAGGLLLSTSGAFPVERAALQRPDLLAGRQPRTINMSRIGDALCGDADALGAPGQMASETRHADTPPAPIEALVIYNSNPAAVAPQSAKVIAGLAREDLFTVVLEQFQTDTADYADWLLPATTQLEHWDIHLSYGHTDVLLNRPALAPRGEARSNSAIFRALAARMGFDEPCFADDDETLCRMAFAADAIDYTALWSQGFTSLPLPDAPFADGGFPTPSGKCEFDSARVAALLRATHRQAGSDESETDMDGVPDHLPNHELPDAAGPFPLAMISPPARNFLNSSFVNVRSLRAIEGEPILEIHAGDAAARGIASGAVVRVFNGRGETLCKADVSTRARPGVVHGLGIWWRKFGLDGSNVNELTSQRLTDIGRGPTFYDCAVQVELHAGS
ncbi:MAG: molybdopterin oxidoreductase family protein [Variovorax sp.]